MFVCVARTQKNVCTQCVQVQMRYVVHVSVFIRVTCAHEMENHRPIISGIRVNDEIAMSRVHLNAK